MAVIARVARDGLAKMLRRALLQMKPNKISQRATKESLYAVKL
jgi:hypothetical protein